MQKTTILTFGALALSLACFSSVRVNTTVAPDANLGALRTFRLMTPPARRDGLNRPNDPMLDNSITNRALRNSIAATFEARGYVRAPGAEADFTVAYYASAREKLDVTQWNYGYPGRWGGWRGPVGYDVSPFIQGTVIIDVINARTQELVWRGRGVSDVSDDPNAYSGSISHTVSAIVDKFPRGPAR